MQEMTECVQNVFKLKLDEFRQDKLSKKKIIMKLFELALKQRISELLLCL